MQTWIRAALVGAALFAGGAAAALAHHGWDWTLDEDFVLDGTIEEIYLGNPHAALKVTSGGNLWQVDLAPPSRTAAAGFVEGVAKVGDAVTAYGHRSKDMNEYRMKAERIRINGVNYDVYPNDLPS
ncbi:MAG TPA: DUF6152 family protein [Bauldia sp.]|nr:DUF6152 family protein [Bauldia sp.]